MSLTGRGCWSFLGVLGAAVDGGEGQALLSNNCGCHQMPRCCHFSDSATKFKSNFWKGFSFIDCFTLFHWLCEHFSEICAYHNILIPRKDSRSTFLEKLSHWSIHDRKDEACMALRHEPLRNSSKSCILRRWRYRVGVVGFVPMCDWQSLIIMRTSKRNPEERAFPLILLPSFFILFTVQ